MREESVETSEQLRLFNPDTGVGIGVLYNVLYYDKKMLNNLKKNTPFIIFKSEGEGEPW